MPDIFYANLVKRPVQKARGHYITNIAIGLVFGVQVNWRTLCYDKEDGISIKYEWIGLRMKNTTKSEIEKIFEKKASYYENTIQALTYYYNCGGGSSKIAWLANLGLFSVFSIYDLWIYMCAYHSSSKNYVKNLNARLVCMGIVESTEDILQMMGKEYHAFFSSLIEDESIRNRAILFRKKLVQFKDDNEREFREVRNYVIAHREHAVLKQVEILNKMDSDTLMQKNMEYLKLIEELHTVINDTIIYISKQLDINPSFAEKLKK